MKRIFTIVAALFMTASVWAQSPEKMSYQAVVRNTNNTLVATQAVGMQISILQGGATGTPIYVETQTPSTNANGLVSLEIGTGTIVSGDFTTIDWANDTYFIKTETDPTGGSTYTITGTSQLMSVPYALYAKTSGSSTPGPTGPQGLAGVDGADGANGIDGLPGADGADGTNGIDGLPGVPGADGTNGIDGLPGVPGADGTNGIDGLPGALGANGADGINGIDGLPGADGADGLLTAGSAAGDTPYWNGTSWVTNNSNVFNNGGNVGIGTSVPDYKLDVNGTVAIGPGTNKIQIMESSNTSQFRICNGGGGAMVMANFSINCDGNASVGAILFITSSGDVTIMSQAAINCTMSASSNVITINSTTSPVCGAYTYTFSVTSCVATATFSNGMGGGIESKWIVLPGN